MRSPVFTRFRIVVLVPLTIELTFAVHQLRAQTPGTGAIAGTVVDPTGAVIVAAKVEVVHDGTQARRSAITSPEGAFRVPLLQPGSYSVAIAAPGFQIRELHGVSVVGSETATLVTKLAIGSAGENIEVSGIAELAQTEGSTLGRAIDQKTIQALPLANRNYTQILALSPGVVVELPSATALGRNTQNVSSNGNKTTANNIQFNGIDANNLALNSASGYQSEVGTAIPAPDTIDEFKVQTTGFDAGYGRGAGANVDFISRSGGNRFHGTLWEFLRNDALNANNFFAKRNGQDRPVLKQNQFGGSIGGPIRKDTLFFFGAYQGSTQRNGGSSLSLVTAILPQLTDDRSARTLGAQFCPENHPGNAGYLTFVGGNQIRCDGSNINPSALGLLNFKFANGQYAIPSPQTLRPSAPDQLPIGESTFSIPAKYREDQYTGNIDSILSSRNQLSGRFFYSRATTDEPFSPFGANVPGWGTNELDQNTMFVLSDTHVFRPSLVNVARFGYMRFDGFSVIAQPINAADVGMATPSGLPQTPGLAINGLFTIGTAGQPFYWQNTNSYIWQDTVSLTRGAHNLRFGAEVKRHHVDVNVPYVSDGFLFLLSLPDFLLGQSAAQNGSSISNVYSSTGSSGIFRKAERYNDLAGFVQDDFRFRPWLTINAGLRYEIFGAPSDTLGRLPTFDPTIASPSAPPTGTLSGFVLPGNYTGPLPNGVLKSSHDGLWPTRFTDISPRIGFAARLPGSRLTVLRGGYGIYYNRMSGNLAEQTVGQPPFSFKQSLQAVQNAGATLQNPYSPTLPPTSAFPIFLPRVPGGTLSLAAISPHLVDPYVQQYNLNVQHEFTQNLLMELGYSGAKSTHIPGCYQFNQALLASPSNPVNGETTNTVENVVERLPFTGIAQGSYICQTSFNSSYNALQTSLTKRLSHGLQFLASYTWSKNLDSLSGSGGLSNFELGFVTNDQTNPRQARGLNDFDRAQRFVLSLVYTTPALSAAPRALRLAASNWLVSTVATAQSGSPLTVLDTAAGSVYGNLSGFMRAECTGANPASGGSLFTRINGYYNPDAFTSAPVIGDGTGFGNCGVGILRGPHQRNIDIALERSFPIRDWSSLKFRAEFFNFTNTANFGNPINDVQAGAAFGLITSTTTNPRIIQFALKYSF
ncbi:TonB-dependent receptor [Edaphobacter aggregans]|uniref:TonB-dependent receptor n=1 Tax=Edaphobacter aggregans TaxID=570835 RepID=UPI000A02AA95|nr:carboxypeptidase-like regulatory domain-containing protein [Edaphobacter aggregans]